MRQTQKEIKKKEMKVNLPSVGRELSSDQEFISQSVKNQCLIVCSRRLVIIYRPIVCSVVFSCVCYQQNLSGWGTQNKRHRWYFIVVIKLMRALYKRTCCRERNRFIKIR